MVKDTIVTVRNASRRIPGGRRRYRIPNDGGLAHHKIVAAIGAAEDAGWGGAVPVVVDLIDDDATWMSSSPSARGLMILQQVGHPLQSPHELELTPVGPHESQGVPGPFQRAERATHFP